MVQSMKWEPVTDYLMVKFNLKLNTLFGSVC